MPILQKTTGKCVNRPIGIRKDSSKKVMWPIAQLKCLYTKARSMGNKQEELEAMVQLENYDLIAITDMWWDKSHKQNTGMEGYKFYRRNRQGRKGGGVALYVKWIDREELMLRNSHEQVESLWVKIRH